MVVEPAGEFTDEAAVVGAGAALPRDPDAPWAITDRKLGSYLTDLQHPWRRIRARAGLGEGLPMIGKLLGHTRVQTMARYAHLARDTVKASAARIGDSIERDLGAEQRSRATVPVWQGRQSLERRSSNDAKTSQNPIYHRENALRTLTDLGPLNAAARRGRNAARRVHDPDRLLDEYAAATAAAMPAVTLAVGVTWRDFVAELREIGRRWDDGNVAWAATGAAVLAPHLATVTTGEIYVDRATIAGIEAAAARADLHPIEGGRLTLRPFPTPTARRLAETRGDLRVAPWPRVYADLRTMGVRGEEAAEHLREVGDGR